jgi:hypothetical protein
METNNSITKNYVFELYHENNYVIINNPAYFKGNYVIAFQDIESIELIRCFSFWDKIIKVYFKFWKPSKSMFLILNLKNGLKNIILNDYNEKKTKKAINKINEMLRRSAMPISTE